MEENEPSTSNKNKKRTCCENNPNYREDINEQIPELSPVPYSPNHQVCFNCFICEARVNIEKATESDAAKSVSIGIPSPTDPDPLGDHDYTRFVWS